MSKVMIVGPAYPLRGGLATFNERLARAFLESGNDCELISFSLQYPKVLFPGKTQFSDEAPPDDIFIHTSINSVGPLSWFKTAKYIAKRKPDLVVFRYWMPFMAPALGTIARIVRKKSNKTKLVAITDNIIPHEKFPFSKPLNSYFLKSFHAFITMSETVMADLKTFIPNPRAQLCLHPLYDNFGSLVPKPQAIEKLQLNPNHQYVLFFGFIRKYKGLDLLLEAFADPRFRNRSIRLLIAGEFYDSPEHYNSLIEQHQLEDLIVRRHEFIPNSEVADYFSASDLIALTYHSATQSGVTQVAYHFEKPMLATNVGGLEETVPHGKVGYCVEKNPTAIADSILDFFDNQRENEFLEGIQEEKKKYSWDNLVSALQKI
jgi:glycosyltransferase involved in cell wall biosynthesis